MQLMREARALCERVRGRGMGILIGSALMAPAAVLMATDRLDDLKHRSTVASMTGEALPDPATEALLEKRERELVVAAFAKEFSIPLEMAGSIYRAALAEDIAPRVAFGLVQAESSFRPRAVSPVGAVGLTQLLPSTARWMVPGTSRQDLMKPETNLRVGFKYLRHLMDRFEGDEMLALTAYNRGPGTVNRLISRGADPDNGYAEKVLTGSSEKHVRLMNAKFGGRRRT